MDGMVDGWSESACWVGRRRMKCEEIALEGAGSCIVTFTRMIGTVGCNYSLYIHSHDWYC